VYEEEFGMAQAWRWSPDSRHIAFWQLDDSAEPVMQLTEYAGAHPEYERLRIPQPGDSNATVRIGVVDVHSGRRVWLDTGEEGDIYIPRIYWTSRPDTLAVLELNRPQNVMTLYFFDVTTGRRRLVMTQRSPTWIDVYDFYAGVQDLMSFPEGSTEFFWLSDQDGWQHIYRSASSTSYASMARTRGGSPPCRARTAWTCPRTRRTTSTAGRPCASPRTWSCGRHPGAGCARWRTIRRPSSGCARTRTRDPSCSASRPPMACTWTDP
jgi:dipeptidyl-peptidase-4